MHVSPIPTFPAPILTFPSPIPIGYSPSSCSPPPSSYSSSLYTSPPSSYSSSLYSSPPFLYPPPSTFSLPIFPSHIPISSLLIFPSPPILIFPLPMFPSPSPILIFLIPILFSPIPISPLPVFPLPHPYIPPPISLLVFPSPLPVSPIFPSLSPIPISPLPIFPSLILIFLIPIFFSPIPLNDKVASLQLTFPDDENEYVEVFRRRTDDLPAHVCGTAYWHSVPYRDRRPGYRVHIQGHATYVEFINDAWHILEKRGDEFVTRARDRIHFENSVGLGWWNNDDEQNPQQLPTLARDEEPLQHISTELPNPDLVEQLTTAFRQLTPIHIDVDLVEEISDEEPPTTRAAPVTATLPAFPAYAYVPPIAPVPPTTMATRAPLMGSLKGTAPNVFTSDRKKSDQFLREFRQYRRNNRTHEMILNPFS
ncbi:hypothetical protein EDB83DRAFT_2528882 [Lactarius deliciosus]|nr:hypothetical protein EDB83DRAFT_2528882 [Lactarius deliciosus]